MANKLSMGCPALCLILLMFLPLNLYAGCGASKMCPPPESPPESSPFQKPKTNTTTSTLSYSASVITEQPDLSLAKSQIPKNTPPRDPDITFCCTEQIPPHLTGDREDREDREIVKLSRQVLEDLVQEGSFVKTVHLILPPRARIEKIQHRGRAFALKSSCGDDHRAELAREYLKHREMGISHLNIVTLLGATGTWAENIFHAKSLLFIFYPIDLKCYNLFQWLTHEEMVQQDIPEDMIAPMKSMGEVDLSQPTALKLICQLLEGLAYLHQKKLGHSDLKPDNCLIKKRSAAANDLLLVICDIAYVAPMENQVDKFSIEYLPPECLRLDEKLTAQIYDIWALGLVMANTLTKPCYEHIDGECPAREQMTEAEYIQALITFSEQLQHFMLLNHQQLFTNVPVNISYMPARANAQEAALDCSFLLLSPLQSFRPSVDEVLQHLKSYGLTSF